MSLLQMIAPSDIGIFLALASTMFLASIISRKRLTARSKPTRPTTVRPTLVASVRAAASIPSVTSPTKYFDNWLERVLDRSGWKRSPMKLTSVTVTLTIVCVAITASAIAFVFEMSVLSQAIIGITAVGAQFGAIYLAMVRRIGKFCKQFPTALELMARATRAGASFESALRIASSSSPEPLRTEFSHCVSQLQLGLTPARAAADLARRVGTMELELFAHTISVHGRVGGQLASALERLSSIIRERSEFADKLRSATGIARLAIFSVVAIGGFVLIYLQMAEPDYLQKLVSSSLGKKLIAYAVVSEIVGLAWVAMTLKLEL